MNKVELIGRLTKDPEVRYLQMGAEAKAVAKFRLAVDRKYKKDGGDTADFISCVAFGKTAEFIEKYFTKGKKVAAVGRIQSGRYQNKEGQTVYTTDVVVEEVEFCESKNSSSESEVPSEPTTKSEAPTAPDDFMSIPDWIEEEIPFGK